MVEIGYPHMFHLVSHFNPAGTLHAVEEGNVSSSIRYVHYSTQRFLGFNEFVLTFNNTD